MDKDEILQKAQSEKEGDEMETQAFAAGSKLAFNVGIAVCLLLLPLKMITGHPWQDVLGLMGIMSCVPHFYCWKKLKKAQELWNGLIWLAFGLFFSVTYIIAVLFY